ncbi:MAG: fimbria/pilus periplasmic chaperone [Spirochaetes bacterium]|nr:fimbria/pilus periplasmic chaperone [Spirochaetota bacterium]
MKAKRYLFLALTIAGAAATVGAFSFVPMSASIAPSGAQSVISFKVTNDASQSIAVVISVMTRAIDIDGKESNETVGKDFTIFPTRIVVQPNSFQTVKIQYKGPAALPRENCYRVIAEQVPIDFSKQETSGVKVLFRYIAALYVTPPKVMPNIQMDTAVGAETDGTKGLKVVIKNTGTRHALLSGAVLKVQDSLSSLPISLTGDQVQAFEGQNMLPASSRFFFVPWDQAVIGKTYTGSFEAEIE